MLPADRVPVRPDHAGAKFVQNLKRRLVALEPELALKLERGHAGGLGGNQIGAPKPR